MTAAMSALERPVRPNNPTIVVEVNTPWWRRAFDAVRDNVMTAAAWIAEKLHLRAGMTHARGYARTGRQYLRVGAGYVGTTGFLGFGLLALSTTPGRRLLDRTVGTTWRVTARTANWITDHLIDGLQHLGRPGRWMADQIETAREGLTTQVIPWVKGVGYLVGDRSTPVGATVWGLASILGSLLVSSRIATLVAGTWLTIPVLAVSFLVTGMMGATAYDRLQAIEGEQTRARVRQAEQTAADLVDKAEAATTGGAPRRRDRGHQQARGNLGEAALGKAASAK